MKFTGKHAAAIALAMTIIPGAEGLRNYAYKDPVGIPTICFGETRDVHLGDYKTTPECVAMLTDRVAEFATGVDKCTAVGLPDKVRGAEISLAYNIGLGAFCSSTLNRKANAGDLLGACNQFPLWNKAHGIALPGLTTRREEERSLCLEGLTK